MGRSLHIVALLVGCSAGEGGAPADGRERDGGEGVSWPAVDTTHDCPVADFTAAGTFALQTGQVYDVEDGEELRLDLYVPDAPGPHPGVAMVHGGGFTTGSLGYMERAAQHYASAGFVVLNVEYRRVPAVGLDDLVRDVVCSIRWGLSEADALGLAPDCVGTMGESAGAYLASMASLAGTDPAFSRGCDTGDDVDVLVRWSVPYYGISDLPLFEASGQLGTLMPGLAELADMSVEALSPTAYAGRDPGVGFFLPHGTIDTVVPVSQSEVFHAALARAGHPVELRLLDGVPHGFVAGNGFDGAANQSIQLDIESFIREMNAAR